jgi:hypothetical protein
MMGMGFREADVCFVSIMRCRIFRNVSFSRQVLVGRGISSLMSFHIRVAIDEYHMARGIFPVLRS